MEALGTRLATTLAPHGLNLVGVADAARYDAAVPERWRIGPHAPSVQSLLVIGNGGGAFWHAFQRRRAADASLRAAAHPLDAFTRSLVREVVTQVAGPLPIVFPFDAGPPALSFVHLAECAGLGRSSLLGILIHPEFGSWIALRAAVLL